MILINTDICILSRFYVLCILFAHECKYLKKLKYFKKTKNNKYLHQMFFHKWSVMISEEYNHDHWRKVKCKTILSTIILSNVRSTTFINYDTK